MNGILCEVKLAALPRGASHHCLSGGAQARMIVGDHELDAAHAALDQVVEESPPVDLGFGQSAGDAEQPAPFINSDADGREHGGVPYHAVIADLLVTSIQDQVSDLVQRTVAPGFQLIVQQLGGSAMPTARSLKRWTRLQAR